MELVLKSKCLMPFKVLPLFLLLGGGGIVAQQPQSSLPGSGSGAGPTNDIRDAWPGIADSTNAWAGAIRRSTGWDEALNANLGAVRPQAQKGMAVAALRLGYSYFVGNGVERDYGEARQWLLKAAESHFAPAEFLLGIGSLEG